jgi:hypothetical protein
VHIGRYILDAEKIEFGNGAGKKTELLDVHNPIVRHNPNVQVIIDEVGKK